MANNVKVVHKLGKKAYRFDHRTFKLHSFLKALPAPLPEASWVTKVPTWPMYLNDQLGDCTVAAAGHMINQWSFFSTGTEALPTNQQILTAYEAVGGYVPNDPSTDNGAVMLDVLNYWRQTGIGGHKITAFASVNLANADELKTAVELFGNVYLGIQLPVTAQGETAWTVADGGTYTQNGAPGSWGGHAIPIVAYSPETLTVITWGSRLKMSWNFLNDYADEAWVVLSEDWITRQQVSPSKFDFSQLQTKLASL